MLLGSRRLHRSSSKIDADLLALSHRDVYWQRSTRNLTGLPASVTKDVTYPLARFPYDCPDSCVNHYE